MHLCITRGSPQAQEIDMATQPKNGLRRGTTGYAINFFRSDILEPPRESRRPVGLSQAASWEA